MAHRLERAFETALFASRWLMAPLYVSLTLVLVALIAEVAQQLRTLVLSMLSLDDVDLILTALTLIDLTLVGNLLLIVVFSGYESFVSKMDIGAHVDRPDWMGTVDFSTLKLKLIASIVAISGIHLLKVFMNIGEADPTQVVWLVTIHVAFVVSGLLLALMDYVSARSKQILEQIKTKSSVGAGLAESQVL